MTTVQTGSSLEHRIGPDGILSIRLHDGDVRLHAVDGEAIRIRDGGDRRLDDLFVIELGDGSASLSSGAVGWRGGPGRTGSADLDVDVPRGATLVIEAGSADIEAEGLLGDQRYRTTSGDMTLRGVAGRIAIDGVSGDVDVVTTGETAVSIRTVSGDVELRAAILASLEAATTSGDLRIAGRLAGPGPFSILTVSGDATLAPAGDLRIEMATLSGDLRSKLGGSPNGDRGRRTLEIGSGGPTVRVRSMSGDLLVLPPMLPGSPGETRSTRTPVTAVVALTEPEPRATEATDAAPDDDERLGILRALERGEIDVDEAGRQLEGLEGIEPPDVPEVQEAAEAAGSGHPPDHGDSNDKTETVRYTRPETTDA